MSFAPVAERQRLLIAILAMILVVAASNYLVQFPLEIAGTNSAEWLTWGAISFPFAFLVTDLTNRAYGPARARQVIAAGFVIAVALSFTLAPWRIAAASGGAFLIGQLLDVSVFNRLRRAAWWLAPFASSALASIVDTGIFFAGAFAGEGLPWMTWAIGDLTVKLVMALMLLAPFRLLMASFAPLPAR